MFVGELSVSPYPDGKTWYLNRQLVYQHWPTTIIVPRGFECDFASVPTAFQNVLPRWDTYGLASVVHDWLYWNQQTTRREADDIFLDAMTESDVPLWKRQTIYYAVRTFGQFAWDDNIRIGKEGYSRIRTARSRKEWTRGTR
jgi:hypothetical protein